MTKNLQAPVQIGDDLHLEADEPSASLQLSDTRYGFLTTRVSTIDRDAIVDPANGLLIFNTDRVQFEFYNLGLTSWMSIGGPRGGNQSYNSLILTVPLGVARGGTGAINIADAQSNLGGTATGINLFTAASAGAALTRLGVGTTGSSIFVANSAATVKTLLGLNNMAVQDAAAVAIRGGTLDGVAIGGITPSTAVFSTVMIDVLGLTNPLAIGQGGTGATDAGTARTLLGLDTMAVQSANSVVITGGNVNLIALTGRTVNSSVIGGRVPDAGTFTLLSVNSTLTLGGFELQSTAPALTALGTNRGTAYAITKTYNEFTTVGASTGAVLPIPVVGMTIMIVNSGSNALSVYPTAGAQINALGANNADSVGTTTMYVYRAISVTQWYR